MLFLVNGMSWLLLAHVQVSFWFMFLCILKVMWDKVRCCQLLFRRVRPLAALITGEVHSLFIVGPFGFQAVRCKRQQTTLEQEGMRRSVMEICWSKKRLMLEGALSFLNVKAGGKNVCRCGFGCCCEGGHQPTGKGDASLPESELKLVTFVKVWRGKICNSSWCLLPYSGRVESWLQTSSWESLSAYYHNYCSS